RTRCALVSALFEKKYGIHVALALRLPSLPVGVFTTSVPAQIPECAEASWLQLSFDLLLARLMQVSHKEMKIYLNSSPFPLASLSKRVPKDVILECLHDYYKGSQWVSPPTCSVCCPSTV